MKIVSKGVLKAKMLEYLRWVQDTGEELVVSDNNRPVVRIVAIAKRTSESIVSGGGKTAWGNGKGWRIRQFNLILGTRDQGQAGQADPANIHGRVRVPHRSNRCSHRVSVDLKIWLKSVDLKWDHDDPADRVIVSTALDCGVPLLTKDNEIRSFHGVNCLW